MCSVGPNTSQNCLYNNDDDVDDVILGSDPELLRVMRKGRMKRVYQ